VGGNVILNCNSKGNREPIPSKGRETIIERKKGKKSPTPFKVSEGESDSPIEGGGEILTHLKREGFHGLWQREADFTLSLRERKKLNIIMSEEGGGEETSTGWLSLRVDQEKKNEMPSEGKVGTRPNMLLGERTAGRARGSKGRQFFFF